MVHIGRSGGGGGGGGSGPVKFVSCNVSKGVPKKILLQPPTSEPATVMQVSSQIAQSVITASSLLFICCSGDFNCEPKFQFWAKQQTN